jgi:hypothetical protein
VTAGRKGTWNAPSGVAQHHSMLNTGDQVGSAAAIQQPAQHGEVAGLVTSVIRHIAAAMDVDSSMLQQCVDHMWTSTHGCSTASAGAPPPRPPSSPRSSRTRAPARTAAPGGGPCLKPHIYAGLDECMAVVWGTLWNKAAAGRLGEERNGERTARLPTRAMLVQT